MTPASPRPLLILYREIVDGDRRKIEAKSNDSPTGGGARDLRFPMKTFDSVMRRIFSEDGTGRGGRSIRTAEVIYRDPSGETHATDLEYWPATPSRGAEGRIARVDKCPAIGGQLPDTSKGRAFLFLIQFSDGTVRCMYSYESDLRGNMWSAEVSSTILSCLEAIDTKNVPRSRNLLPVQGYYDFSKGVGYCHADG